MLPDGSFWTVLSQAIVLLFRSITPICILYTILYLTDLLQPLVLRGLRLRLEFFTVPETLFYLLVYLPKSHALQKPAPEGNVLSRQERRDLIEKCLDNVPDINHFLRTWFKEAPVESLRKEDLRQWLAWGIWNRYNTQGIDPIELAEYVERIERRLGQSFAEGNGPNRPIRISVDPINVQHRPLLWYLLVGLIDIALFVKMWRLKFQYFPVYRGMKSFPFRPLSTLCKEYSTAQDLTYWHRPHKSKQHLPVLYIHGIGIGLYTYSDFFADVISKCHSASTNNEVGVIAIEIMPISFRITSPILRRQEMVHQINQILSHHGWISEDGAKSKRFVLAANSYGTVIAAHLLHDHLISPNIGSVMLIDPITVWVHMGDIAYNFTVKSPRSASEHQLHYFACTDMGAAHAVTRSFIWTENVLWKDEMKDRKFVLVLSGKDIILDAERCKKYLLLGHDEIERSSIGNVSGAESIKAGDMEILWFKHLNHAEVFERMKERGALVNALYKLCLRS